ncbi:hypothetical protein IWW50_005314 [Coemansia erecta]|nr:hypothetical protein GGF43_004752 [Coemansia sp. RSA 2618]KAJ2819829.1 hypothetical protein IWW50_005314 [Coemansia erecta]
MFTLAQRLRVGVPQVHGVVGIARTMASHTPSTKHSANQLLKSANGPKNKQVKKAPPKSKKEVLAERLAKEKQKARQIIASVRAQRRREGQLRLIGSAEKTTGEEAHELTLERMVAAGVHLGHSAGRWNPMNLPYIFGERQGIHIINLEQTMAMLRRAAQFVRQTAYHGGLILFVGTRRAHRDAAVEAALACNQYFVTGKWVPGTITNQKSLLNLHFAYADSVWDVAEVQEMVEVEARQKKELAQERAAKNRFLAMIEKEKSDLEAYAARRPMHKPDLIIALSPRESATMLHEARATFVPTVGVIDTNADPRSVTYPIPCNDDSTAAVELVAQVLARAAREGMELRRHRLLAAAQKYNQKAIEEESSREFMEQIGLDTE